MSEDQVGFSVFEGAGSSGVGVSRSMIVWGAFPKLCIGGRGVLNAPEAAIPVAGMPMVGCVFPKGVAADIIVTDAPTADMSMAEPGFLNGVEVGDMSMSNAPVPNMSIDESGFQNDVAVMSMSDASIADMSIVELKFLKGVADMPMAGCVSANMGAPVVVAIGNMEFM